ncbi:glycoside hydrolase family 127 protein [Acutalibacter caecimuris]|uniref:glycoside hydrolase family 127 protein n=1 Tax=Acutalibacter caecimuris TaxID=3093657 RepID=UPI002AC8F744|nr:beta-L-arabinofuranosidase domain-containing protein [Acutalibacter sp. M00118]
MEQKQHSRPVSLRDVRVADPFWQAAQETVRREMLPYQWEALNDRVEGAAPSFCIHNFRAAARLMEEKRNNPGFVEPAYTFRGFECLPEDPAHPEADRFYGFVFQDTDFYKWIEAVGYSLAQHPDAELERTADGAIDLLCAAQHDSGYLDTYYILNGMDGAFTNLKDHHELYCLGHLAEAAVAYYEATGKDKLLGAACRFAGYVDSQFGPEPGKRKGYPGHEIAEMALVRLYEATGERKYLNLARFFIDQRGTAPHYFLQEDRERAARSGKPAPQADTAPYAYYQADRPVREQEQAQGHAVRAGYLYAGMADVARLTGDQGLWDACRRLWDEMVGEKLYITGGVGGTVHGEAFSYPFDLPNDTAYSETCAAIALAFFARRMLELEPKGTYADVMELAMYNTVLAGMALDGKSFFYVNPLEVNPAACLADQRLQHVKPVRQKWFGCACCPPNIARIVTAGAQYAFTGNDTTLFTHLYMGGEISRQVGGHTLRLALESHLPWEGRARMTVHTDSPVAYTLAFRVPGWCAGPVIAGPDGMERTEKDGYVYLTGTWREGDRVDISLPMETRLVAANPWVREDTGKVAVLRGPICYCLEEADNGPGLHLVRVDAARAGEARPTGITIGGQGMRAIDLPGFRQAAPGSGAPLYSRYAPAKEEPVTLRFIPYYAWANRGMGEMRVWVRV